MKSLLRKELAVALDTQSRDEFLRLFEEIKDLDVVIKIGLKMLPRLESADWRAFGDRKIFVDAKLHDIPSQVRDAVVSYGDLGARYLTVHLSGGRQMLEEAQKAASSFSMTLLGVSVLTSLSDTDLKQMGQWDVGLTVERLVSLGRDSGLRAFVMSPWELSIKSKFPDLFCVTPGISLEGAKAAPDQARVATLKQALELGSDMPVIGRAITQNQSARNTARAALEMVRQHS